MWGTPRGFRRFLSAVPQRLPWTTMVGNGNWRYSAVLKADGAGCRRRQTIDASAIPRFCGTARRKVVKLLCRPTRRRCMTTRHRWLSDVWLSSTISHIFFPKNVRGKHIIRGGNVGVRIAIIVRRHIRRLQMGENYRSLSCAGRLIRHCGKKTYAAVCVYSNNAASVAG